MKKEEVTKLYEIIGDPKGKLNAARLVKRPEKNIIALICGLVGGGLLLVIIIIVTIYCIKKRKEKD